MKKLIEGIVEFRRNVRDGYREAFARLATGQSPDALFIACSDSRVVPNTFASTNPGDLFVIRNVGNIVPPCDKQGVSSSDESEAAAIEFSINILNVSDIIICGHSECGAMVALAGGRSEIDLPHLKSWLRHGEESLKNFREGKSLDPNLSAHNQLSQLNVLLQIEHVKTYPEVEKRINEGKLRIHGWWFDILTADVYAYEDAFHKFVLIDENEAQNLLRRFR